MMYIRSLRKTWDLLRGFIEEKITIKSTLKSNQEDELEKLANLITEDIKKEG